MTSKDTEVIYNMNRFGGSFVKKLSELALLADDENLAKLKKVFAEYWEEYGDSKWRLRAK